MTRYVDVTGLSDATIAAVEHLVSTLKQFITPPPDEVPIAFATRDEWRKAIREWAASHPTTETSADWSRDNAYAGCGE